MENLDRAPDTIRKRNRSRVFSILAAQGKISRSELAQASGLNRATISSVIEDFAALDLVEEVGPGHSRGGRPPMLLEFNPDAAYALGASMRDHSWTLVRTDLAARIVDRETVTMRDLSPSAAVDAVTAGVEELRRRAGSATLLPALGLGPPGLVDVRSGLIVSAADVGWANVPFGSLVESRTGLPTAVANRSKVSALAEYWHTDSRRAGDLIYVSVGTGVAAGVIHRGELFMGTNSSAGELGHVTVLPDGPPCACGNRGCLQQLVSESALAQRARIALRSAEKGLLLETAGHLPEHLAAEDVLEAGEAGDETAVAVIRETAEYLAIGVATLVNLFNPRSVCLGGPMIEQSRLLYEETVGGVQRRAMSYPLSVLDIRRSALGMEAGAVGASVLILKNADKLLFS